MTAPANPPLAPHAVAWRRLAALAVAALALACSRHDPRTCGPGTRADGDGCVPAVDAASLCGAATHLEDGRCVADVGPGAFCGAGTVAAGALCVPSPDPAPWCGPGTVAAGGRCVPDGDPTRFCGSGTVPSGGLCVFAGDVSRSCGAGTVPSGGACVPATAPSSYCGPGTALAGTRCAPTADPASRCGAGTTFAGGLCVPQSPPAERCGRGTLLEGGRCVPSTPPAHFCGQGTVFTDGSCLSSGDPAGFCGPGTSLVGGVCRPIADAPRCGPGTTSAGGSCVPAVDPAAHCGAGTVLAGDLCIPARAPGDHCGAGTHLAGGLCVPDADATPWCGPGTYPAGASCLASGANGWRVLVPVANVPPGWRLPVRVVGPPGVAPEAVVLALTRAGAGVLDPAAVWVDSDGGSTWLAACDAGAAGCAGPVRVAAYRRSDLQTPVAVSEPVEVAPSTGVGTPAPCLIAPNVLFLDGVTFVWKGVSAITDAGFAAPTVAPDHLYLQVRPADPSAGDAWDLALSSTQLGAPLAPGVYEAAGDYPFEPAGSPGLSISGGNRVCSPLTGRFEIQRLDLAGATLRELLATFEMTCGVAYAPLRACIHLTAP